MSENICLQWNDFKDDITSAFGSLREDNDFADVILVCEDGQQVEAHKVILASSSPFFQHILRNSKHPHPLIYMRGMKSDDLLGIIDFLYFGEANIYQENLDSFLVIAEELQLKGLTERGEDLKLPVSVKKEPDQKKKRTKTEYALPLQSMNSENDVYIVEGCVATGPNLFGNFQELEKQTNSMMEKTSKKIGRQPIYVCKVCGKEEVNSNLKKHIESKHLRKVIPCDKCEKTFNCRTSLTTHKNQKHRDHQDLV